MLYTTRKIKDIKTCSYKGYLSQFSYNTEQNQFLHLLSLTKQCIKEGIYKKSYDAIRDWFDENVDDSFYIFEQQKGVDRKSFVAHMKRFGVYMRDNQGEIIDSNVSHKIEVLEEEILIKADFIVRYPDKIEVVKISNSKPKLSYNARSEENKPANSFELWLMQKLGEEKYPVRKISSAFYHMVGKYDSGENYEKFLNNDTEDLIYEVLNLESEYNSLIEQKKKREANKIQTVLKKIKGVINYDGEQGSHIIRQSAFNENYILDELHEVFNKDLSEGSEKVVSSECDKCKNYVLCQARQHVKVDLEVVEEEIKGGKKKVTPTEKQLEYINFEEGVARINSSAGSGKTNTTVLRTAKLLETYSPSDILLITFTNKGAEEIRDRVSKITTANPHSLNIYTFNGFGMSLVEKEWERLVYTKKPQLINKIDKVDYIAKVLSEGDFSNLDFLNYKYPLMNLPNAKGSVYTMYNYFNQIKAGMFDESNEHKDIIYKMYNRYNEILKENNQLEYDDQILLAIELLKNEDMVEKYGFTHIMVDEFQDTNPKQIELLNLLRRYSGIKSVANIGHDSQSIFGFRLATPEFMVNFEKYFGDFTDIKMDDNFRSYKEVCDLANRYIKLNDSGVEMDMISVKGEGGRVELTEFDTLEDEYNSIVNHISQNNNGKNYHEYAILASTSKELLEIQKKLNQANIPSKLATPQKHMDNHNIRLCINLAKYLKSDDVDTNDYYLFEYVSLISEETDKDDLALLISQTKDVIINLQDEDYSKMEIFDMMISTLFTKQKDEIAEKFIKNLLLEREWYNFTDFADHLSKHVLYNDDTQSEKDETNYNAIILTTYHSSKGREFEKVFLLLDNIKYDVSTEIDDLEEQRRLVYVGITRAIKELYMVYNINMDKSRGKGKYPLVADEIRRFM